LEPNPLIEAAKAFVDAISSGESVERFLAPDVVQVEYPNKLLPNGATRDFHAICQAQKSGQKLLSTQSFEVLNAVASGNCVVPETIWTGTLAFALGALLPGAVMRARFAQIFEFKNGQIVHLRNYDCFDPW
jgi:ketosteroid isomerase-like protein